MLNWKRTKFRMLWNIPLPSSIAGLFFVLSVEEKKEEIIGKKKMISSIWPYMIVLKLSSTKIMSAASLDTSVPDLPMAMPISADLSATASLTPSPVIATI